MNKNLQIQDLISKGIISCTSDKNLFLQILRKELKKKKKDLLINLLNLNIYQRLYAENPKQAIKTDEGHNIPASRAITEGKKTVDHSALIVGSILELVKKVKSF